MPRTRSIAWSELKIGIVGVAAIVLVTVLILAVGGQGGFFWQRYPLKVRFDAVNGLRSGAVVRLNGMDVGKVTAVAFAGPRIDVDLQVSRDVRPLITTASRAAIGSLSLLGEPVIDLTVGSSGTPLPDWSYVRTGEEAGSLGALTTTASQGLQQANEVLADVRAGRGTLGKLVTDDRLYTEMEQFVSAANDVARTIDSGKGTIGQLANDPAVAQELRASLQNLAAITDRVNRGQGALGKLLDDDALASSLSATVAHLDQATRLLTTDEGTAGKLLTNRELYDRMDTLTQRLDTLVQNLSAGQGTAGALLHDRQLYENMNQAATELRGLLGDIRKDPKKFLRVGISIF